MSQRHEIIFKKIITSHSVKRTLGNSLHCGILYYYVCILGDYYQYPGSCFFKFSRISRFERFGKEELLSELFTIENAFSPPEKALIKYNELLRISQFHLILISYYCIFFDSSLFRGVARFYSS